MPEQGRKILIKAARLNEEELLSAAEIFNDRSIVEFAVRSKADQEFAGHPTGKGRESGCAGSEKKA